MNNFQIHFGQSPILLVVVHAFEIEQVQRNAAIAFNAGADGIFLIAGKMNWEKLCDCYSEVRARFLEAWIGLNLLDLEPEEAFQQMPQGVNGLWADNAGTRPPRRKTLRRRNCTVSGGAP